MKKFLIILSFMSGMMVTAAAQTGISTEQIRQDREATLRLPKSDVHYRETSTYIEDVPDKDYVHASADAYEQFRAHRQNSMPKHRVFASEPIKAPNYDNKKKDDYLK